MTDFAAEATAETVDTATGGIIEASKTCSSPSAMGSIKGLPEAITTTWQRTFMQQCVVHPIRSPFRDAGRGHHGGIVKVFTPVHTAPCDRFTEFDAQWAHGIGDQRTVLRGALDNIRTRFRQAEWTRKVSP